MTINIERELDRAIASWDGWAGRLMHPILEAAGMPCPCAECDPPCFLCEGEGVVPETVLVMEDGRYFIGEGAGTHPCPECDPHWPDERANEEMIKGGDLRKDSDA